MYYVDVYLDLLRTTTDVHGHLLSEDERALIGAIVGLEANAQRLLFRLLSRARAWLQVDKLEYAEVSVEQIDFASDPIRGIFDVNPDHKEPYLGVLKIETVRSLAVEFGAGTPREVKRMPLGHLVLLCQSVRRPKQSKISFADGFKAGLVCERDMLSRIREVVGGDILRVAPRVADLFDRTVLPLYFVTAGDPVEELRRAMLAKTEKHCYPKYCMVRSRPIFATRENYEDYREAVAMFHSLEHIPDEASLVETATELTCSFHWLTSKWSGLGESPFLQRYSPMWLMAKSLGWLAGRLEALGRHALAAAIYADLLGQPLVCHGRRGGWWERLILDWHKHLKADVGKVRDLCVAALQDRHVRMGARLSIEQRLGKLTGSVAPPLTFTTDFIVKERVSRKARGASVLYHLDDQGTEVGRVEELALRFYSDQGWRGVHSESGAFTMLFALVFWDILFMSVPDVFQTPLQTCPLDLQTDSFYDARRESIEERLAEVRSGAFGVSQLESAFDTHRGTMCVGVHWDAFDVQFLSHVFGGLGREAAVVVLRSLAMDYRHYSSGMPDLVLWRDTSVLLVEVKSETDKLSEQQKSWLSILRQCGIDVRVCKVCAKIRK